MLRKINYALVLIALTASASYAQSKSMYVGDVELRLGMSRDSVMKLLNTGYKLTATGVDGFAVGQYDQKRKRFNLMGAIVFENNKLDEITRAIDTSDWPDDQGFAVARVISDALSGSIPLTDSDGAKRADARIVISSHDAIAGSRHGNTRDINIFVNGRKISIMTWDGTDGRRVDVQETIRTKPWREQ